MNAFRLSWIGWLHANWAQLVGGSKLEAPTYLTHPRYSGFGTELLATPQGQVADWVVAVTDGSRIHVHECADRRLVVHRDRYDPNRSVGYLVAHLVAETALVPVLLLVVAVVIASRSAGRA